MIGRAGGPLGLLGRILVILLLAVVIEFGASTFLYERASRFSVREDEARRLAEHLVIARKLVTERPWRARPAAANELTTDRYVVRWTSARPDRPRFAPALDDMKRQIVAWEPALGSAPMDVRLTSPGRQSAVTGELRLEDGSWLLFRTRETIHSWDLALGRVALALVPALALLLLAGLAIRRTLAPLRVLARATERVGTGDTRVLPETGTSEVRQLIGAFNAMQHRIHDLIEDRTQALAAVGHDLRTPLARLQLRAEAIEAPDLRGAIDRDLGEMGEMLTSLLAFLGGEDDPEKPVMTDVAVLAATVVDAASDGGGDARYDGPDHLDARVRPMGLKRALTNLVENALHYGASAKVTLAAGAAGIRIMVEDRGPGVPEDRLEEVLRPFTRLDQARARNTKGLGLGLAIVARAVEREGGTLMLANRPEGGLVATILLPITAET